MTAAGAERIEAAIRAADDGTALAAFLTAGYPRRAGFADVLARVAEAADVVEIGVPFSDPMADGVTIQDASRVALADGVTLDWIFELVERSELAAPVVLMSYLNPLLTRRPDRLAADAAEAGVDGFIVPDLPLEESGALGRALSDRGLALVQLVTPLSDPGRRDRLAAASTGFLYAVTRTGTTGAGRGTTDDGAIADYLDDVRSSSDCPVLAGFGIRRREQVERLRDHVDGFIVGSALLECVTAGDDPAAFLASLRAGGSVAAGGAP